MTDAYRNENESLQARNQQLEQALAERTAQVEGLERRLSSEAQVFARLNAVLDARGTAPRRWPVLVASAMIAGLGLMGGWIVSRSHLQPSTSAPAGAAPERLAPPGGTMGGFGALSDQPGIHLQLEDRMIFVPVDDAEDLAGYKYRKDGDRSVWFTVAGSQAGGPRFDCSQRAPRVLDHVYVHGVADFLSVQADGAAVPLTLFTIRMGDGAGGYRLARDARATVTARTEDGYVIGRFEAEMNKVEDTTREAPKGASLVRVRGTFRLPAAALDPSDTGP